MKKNRRVFIFCVSFLGIWWGCESHTTERLSPHKLREAVVGLTSKDTWRATSKICDNVIMPLESNERYYIYDTYFGIKQKLTPNAEEYCSEGHFFSRIILSTTGVSHDSEVSYFEQGLLRPVEARKTCWKVIEGNIQQPAYKNEKIEMKSEEPAWELSFIQSGQAPKLKITIKNWDNCSIQYWELEKIPFNEEN